MKSVILWEQFHLILSDCALLTLSGPVSVSDGRFNILIWEVQPWTFYSVTTRGQGFPIPKLWSCTGNKAQESQVLLGTQRVSCRKTFWTNLCVVLSLGLCQQALSKAWIWKALKCTASPCRQTPWPPPLITQTINASAEIQWSPGTAPLLEHWTSAPVKTVSLHLLSRIIRKWRHPRTFFYCFIILLISLAFWVVFSSLPSKQENLSTSLCPTSFMAVPSCEKMCWAWIPSRSTIKPTWMWNL